MSSKISEFIINFSKERPDLSSELSELQALYEGRLWHQLSIKLENLLSSKEFQLGEALITLYTGFVSEFISKLNQLKVAQFVSKVAECYQEPDKRIEFIKKVEEKLTKEMAICKTSENEDCLLFFEMQIAKNYLIIGDEVSCKSSIEKGIESLEARTDIDPSVSAAVYYVSSQFHKVKKNYGEFYKHALMYLAFTSTETLEESFKQRLVIDISLAALLANDVFNFGELLLHPILSSLESAGCKWLLDILEAFNCGNMTQFEKICQEHSSEISAIPELLDNVDGLKQKITIMCLLELIFSLPAEERHISLTSIAERTKLDADGVEFLLMRALSLHLIEGKIDQVGGYVQMTWVHPRVLTYPEIQGLHDKLDNWITKVKKVNLDLEQETLGVVEC